MSEDLKTRSANKLVSDLRDLADWIEAGVVMVEEIYTDCHVAMNQPTEQTLSLSYIVLPIHHNA